jgi:ubiquinone/menaquinone biosynthesis C-methylase UbiE
MLARTLEPELMDTPETAAEYDALDHTEVNRAYAADFLAGGSADGILLDLGTGTAQLPIELCRQHEECRILAVDLSVPMLELARYNIEIAGLIQRIQLAQVDIKALPYPDDQFAAVLCNGSLHHLAQPLGVLAEALRVTAPLGRLFFRDLLRPDSEDDVQRLLETYAGQANQHQRELFAASLRAALRVEEMRGLVAQLGFPPQSVQATSDRHWTWCAQKTRGIGFPPVSPEDRNGCKPG